MRASLAVLAVLSLLAHGCDRGTRGDKLWSLVETVCRVVVAAREAPRYDAGVRE